MPNDILNEVSNETLIDKSKHLSTANNLKADVPMTRIATTQEEIMRLSNCDLVVNTKALVAKERKITRILLEYIDEIERRRVYADLGYSATYEWLIKDLGYSESAAYRRLQAARLIRANPSTAAKIETGAMNLTTMAQVQTAIKAEERRTGTRLDQEQQAKVVATAESRSSRETERELVRLFPELPKSHDVVRAIDESHVRIHLTLTQTTLRKLERVGEVLSHKIIRTNEKTLPAVIDAAADDVLKHRDPLQREIKSREGKHNERDHSETKSFEMKATDAKKRCNTGAGVALRSADQGQCRTNRDTLSPSLRNFVYRRDSGQCQFRQEGRICGSRNLTQIDHIIPKNLGGKDEPSNLRVLCRTHNLLMAERVYGRDKIDEYRNRAIDTPN